MHTLGDPRFRAELHELVGHRPTPLPVGPDGVTHPMAANESPHGPLPTVVAAMAGALSDANRYPDFGAPALAVALAGHLDRTPHEIVLGCGSTDLIRTVLTAVAEPGGEVVLGVPTFESYPRMIRLAGMAPVTRPLRDDVHDLDAMARAVTSRTRLVVVCNPNNPTGTAVGHDALEAFLDRIPATCPVLLDEAYHEYVRDPAVADGLALRRRRNVIVMRTFSKAYGLAGLRVGYAVTDPGTAGLVRRAALSFGVSRVAQAGAIASLAAAHELRERVDRDLAERERVAGALRAAGMVVPPGHANFVWVRPGPLTDALAAACPAHGVAVRVVEGHGMRITVGSPASNDALLAAARAVPALAA